MRGYIDSTVKRRVSVVMSVMHFPPVVLHFERSPGHFHACLVTTQYRVALLNLERFFILSPKNMQAIVLLDNLVVIMIDNRKYWFWAYV